MRLKALQTLPSGGFNNLLLLIVTGLAVVSSQRSDPTPDVPRLSPSLPFRNTTRHSFPVHTNTSTPTALPNFTATASEDPSTITTFTTEFVTITACPCVPSPGETSIEAAPTALCTSTRTLTVALTATVPYCGQGSGHGRGGCVRRPDHARPTREPTWGYGKEDNRHKEKEDGKHKEKQGGHGDDDRDTKECHGRDKDGCKKKQGHHDQPEEDYEEEEGKECEEEQGREIYRDSKGHQDEYKKSSEHGPEKEKGGKKNVHQEKEKEGKKYGNQEKEKGGKKYGHQEKEKEGKNYDHQEAEKEGKQYDHQDFSKRPSKEHTGYSKRGEHEGRERKQCTKRKSSEPKTSDTDDKHGPKNSHGRERNDGQYEDSPTNSKSLDDTKETPHTKPSGGHKLDTTQHTRHHPEHTTTLSTGYCEAGDCGPEPTNIPEDTYHHPEPTTSISTGFCEAGDCVGTTPFPPEPTSTETTISTGFCEAGDCVGTTPFPPDEPTSTETTMVVVTVTPSVRRIATDTSRLLGASIVTSPRVTATSSLEAPQTYVAGAVRLGGGAQVAGQWGVLIACAWMGMLVMGLGMGAGGI